MQDCENERVVEHKMVVLSVKEIKYVNGGLVKVGKDTPLCDAAFSFTASGAVAVASTLLFWQHYTDPTKQGSKVYQIMFPILNSIPLAASTAAAVYFYGCFLGGTIEIK